MAKKSKAKRSDTFKRGAYFVMHSYLCLLLDTITCAALGECITSSNTDSDALLAFGTQLNKFKSTSKQQMKDDKRIKCKRIDPEIMEELERINKTAFLRIGCLNEYTTPILLDEDFCIVLGKFIEANGSDNASIRRIGRRLLKAKEYNVKRTIKWVKARRKNGESFKHISKELGISVSTASKYSKL
jgi:hypothetical protein